MKCPIFVIAAATVKLSCCYIEAAADGALQKNMPCVRSEFASLVQKPHILSIAVLDRGEQAATAG